MTSESRVRILVADADCALFGLLREWFAEKDYVLRGACQPDATPRDGHDVILLDLPFPKRGRHDAVKALERAHPGTPIVALSSSFLPGVEASGTVARELGVAGVVPKPLDRCALMATVRGVLGLR